MTLIKEATIAIVWNETRYDSGLYDCKVERVGDTGRLSVTLLGQRNHVIHEETVKVERADTDKWRMRCVAVINDPSLRCYEATFGT